MKILAILLIALLATSAAFAQNPMHGSVYYDGNTCLQQAGMPPSPQFAQAGVISYWYKGDQQQVAGVPLSAYEPGHWNFPNIVAEHVEIGNQMYLRLFLADDSDVDFYERTSLQPLPYGDVPPPYGHHVTIGFDMIRQVSSYKIDGVTYGWDSTQDVGTDSPFYIPVSSLTLLYGCSADPIQPGLVPNNFFQGTLAEGPYIHMSDYDWTAYITANSAGPQGFAFEAPSIQGGFNRVLVPLDMGPGCIIPFVYVTINTGILPLGCPRGNSSVYANNIFGITLSTISGGLSDGQVTPWDNWSQVAP